VCFWGLFVIMLAILALKLLELNLSEVSGRIIALLPY
jgi:hypothetical protein